MADRHPVFAKEKFLTRDDVRRVALAEAETSTSLMIGQIIERTTGAALGGHRAVHVATDGLAYYSAPDSTARFTLGLTTGAAALGATATIQCDGVMVEPSWSWVGTEVVWLAADGALTQTVPTAGVAFQVGVPAGPTSLRIEPQLVAKIS